MFIFWIAAAGTSKLSCDDYCKACSDWPSVDWNGLFCICGLSLSDIYKRDTSPAMQGLRGILEPRRSRGSSHSSSDKAGTVTGSTAGNAIMTYVFFLFFSGLVLKRIVFCEMCHPLFADGGHENRFLFFVTLVATIWWIFSQRRSNGTAAPTMAPPTQAEAGNAGYPMTSNPQPAPGYTPKMAEQYPPGQPQPQSQQPVYDPSHPQGQYPPQQAYQPGAPAQY